MAQDFDFAALEVVVGRAFRAGTHQALDLHTKLVAQAFCDLEHLGAVGIADHLHIAFTVAQVHKNHAAVVTATVDPAAQRDRLAQQGLGHQTTVGRAHRRHFWLSDRGAACAGLRKGFQWDWMAGLSGPSGTTTPMEMMYLSALSTDISSSITCWRGNIMKKPEVGLGVVGMNTLT